jgi:hypothetical protein
MTTESAANRKAERADGDGGDERSVDERAEEIVERVSEEVTRFARRMVGRLREEIEDIVAEGQTIRRGGRPPG